MTPLQMRELIEEARESLGLSALNSVTLTFGYHEENGRPYPWMKTESGFDPNNPASATVEALRRVVRRLPPKP